MSSAPRKHIWGMNGVDTTIAPSTYQVIFVSALGVDLPRENGVPIWAQALSAQIRKISLSRGPDEENSLIWRSR